MQIEAATGKTIHQGLYPESRIIEALDQALRILHSEEYPLLIRLALFHYFFVYIHPFMMEMAEPTDSLPPTF